ncbi:MAG TPA: TetR/AcrR family transcriptional regulator [Allocoleopsis sp.]
MSKRNPIDHQICNQNQNQSDIEQIEKRQSPQEIEDLRRPERRDAAENRQRILTVARQLFAAHGVENVTMYQIAKATGIGQGTLYRRYANKGELCFALIESSFLQLCDEIDRDLAQLALSQTYLAQLDHLLGQLVTFVEAQIHLLGAIEDAAIGHKRQEKFCSPLYGMIHQRVCQLLDAAMAAGEILPLNSPFTADALLATLNIELYQFQRHQRGFTPDQILQGIRAIYVDRLRVSSL